MQSLTTPPPAIASVRPMNTVSYASFSFGYWFFSQAGRRWDV